MKRSLSHCGVAGARLALARRHASAARTVGDIDALALPGLRGADNVEQLPRIRGAASPPEAFAANANGSMRAGIAFASNRRDVTAQTGAGAGRHRGAERRAGRHAASR